MTTHPVQAIRVRGLVKSFKKLEVLRGVELEVAPGSIVVCRHPHRRLQPRHAHLPTQDLLGELLSRVAGRKRRR